MLAIFNSITLLYLCMSLFQKEVLCPSVGTFMDVKSRQLERSSYSLEFKQRVLKYAEDNGNPAAQKHFSVNECTLRSWRKRKSVIQEMAKVKLGTV